MTMHEIASDLSRVRTERQALERQAQELKAQETELEQALLAELSAQNVKSVNLEGFGRVVRRDTPHYEIGDANALAVAMLKSLVAAAKERRPLSEGFMLQRRASRDAIETYIHDMSGLNPDDDGFDAQCAAIGVNRVVRQGISITKSK